MGDAIKYFVFLVVVLGITLGMVLGAHKLFSDAMSDYEIFEPEPGVRCVAISRIYNTSVDCWKVDETDAAH